MRDLDHKRTLFEQKWKAVRDSLQHETGRGPKSSRWIWIVAAAAGGLAAAWGTKRRKVLQRPTRKP